MDLRSRKTEEAIKKAFYDLRQKKDTTSIRVREICERARINKSTFYRHYTDIFALEKQMEDGIVEEIVEDICEGPSIYEDIEKFFEHVEDAFNGEKNCRRKEILFSCDYSRLLTKVEDLLRQRYLEEYRHSFDEYIRITYILGGAFSTFRVGKYHMQNPNVPEIYKLLIQYTDNTLRGKV